MITFGSSLSQYSVSVGVPKGPLVLPRPAPKPLLQIAHTHLWTFTTVLWWHPLDSHRMEDLQRAMGNDQELTLSCRLYPFWYVLPPHLNASVWK